MQVLSAFPMRGTIIRRPILAQGALGLAGRAIARAGRLLHGPLRAGEGVGLQVLVLQLGAAALDLLRAARALHLPLDAARASFSLPRSTSVSYRASALASRTSAVTSSARASTTESSSLTRWLTRYVPVTFITAQTTSPKVMPISPM